MTVFDVAPTGVAAQCDVVMLVPDRSGRSLLARIAVEREALSLPLARVEVGADLTHVLAAVRDAVGADPRVLRICTLEWNEQFDATLMVVETEACAGDAPDGLRWVAVGPEIGPAVHPSAAQPLVDGWAQERVAGHSQWRPPWSRPGWWDDAVGWALTAAEDVGFRPRGDPELLKMWGISVVLRFPMLGGDTYFKSSCPAFRAEAALTSALADWAPGTLPEVIAVDAAEGRLLMRDMGGVALDEQPGFWAAGLEATADLQRACTERVDALLALGAQARPLSQLAETAAELAQHDDLMSRLSEANRLRWSSAAERVVDACLLLDELGPGPTLVHGDLHQGNMVVVDDTIRIFDWTDAAISHPFVDLISFLRWAPAADHPRLVEAYLRPWADELPPERLAQAAALALPVGAFYQVWTYLLLLPTLLPEDQAQLTNADARWLDRCLTLLDQDSTLTG